MQSEAEQGVEEGQYCSFRKIEELEQHGVNRTDIAKLKAGGFHTIEAVAHATQRKLMEVKGISEQKAAKLKEIIKSNQLVAIGFQTATSCLESMKDVIMISTGD